MSNGKEVAVASVVSKSDSIMKPVKITSLHSENFVKGAYGILEPKENNIIENLNENWLVICPGIAFDDKGNRMGKGKGFLR